MQLTRLFIVVKTKVDHEQLRKELARLSKWGTKWWMKFNVDKRCTWTKIPQTLPTHSDGLCLSCYHPGKIWESPWTVCQTTLYSAAVNEANVRGD